MTENETNRDKKQYLQWLYGKGSERAKREMKPKKKKSRPLEVVLLIVVLLVAWWAVKK